MKIEDNDETSQQQEETKKKAESATPTSGFATSLVQVGGKRKRGVSVGAEGGEEQGVGVKQESKFRKGSVEDEVEEEGGWKEGAVAVAEGVMKRGEKYEKGGDGVVGEKVKIEEEGGVMD